MNNILVIGSINMDIVIYTDKIPKIGETRQGKQFMTNGGGKGANQATAAAKLGANVKMIGCIGNDLYGDIMLNLFKEYNVGTDGVSKIDSSTGTAVITVCNGDNSIIVCGGANMKVTPELIDNNIDLIKWADYCIFQFEIPQETVLYAAKKAKELGKKVIVNPAPIQDFPEELYKYTDILIPNRIECETLLHTELDDGKKLENAILHIKEKGVETVIITLGSEGCIYNDGDTIKRQAAIKTAAIDTTGAGDCFIGGFTSGIGSGKDIEEAIEFASYASSIAVGRQGAAKSLPTQMEVLEKMSEGNIQ